MRGNSACIGGDLFYEATFARRVARFLERCMAAGIDVLVGDPGRAPLPLHRLRKRAEGKVPDFDRSSGIAAAV